MKKITIELQDKDFETLVKYTDDCNDYFKIEMSVEKVILGTMLSRLEDWKNIMNFMRAGNNDH